MPKPIAVEEALEKVGTMNSAASALVALDAQTVRSCLVEAQLRSASSIRHSQTPSRFLQPLSRHRP